jgi:maleate cis-trans isomerase
MSDDRRKWRRVGVIVPSPNTTVEADFMRALPANVTVHAARMFLAETTAGAERRMIYDHVPIAVADLATLRPHVVAFACTSAGAVLGADGEAALIANIARETGAFVVSTNNAVGKAIETLGRKRIALLTPYVAELNQAIRAGLERRGPTVVHMAGLGTRTLLASATSRRPRSLLSLNGSWQASNLICCSFPARTSGPSRPVRCSWSASASPSSPAIRQRSMRLSMPSASQRIGR